MSTAWRRPKPPWAPGLPRGLGEAFDLASALVIAVVLALVLATFGDYGITWDETWHEVYGDHIVSWFATGGQDTSALCYRIDFMYGGAFDLLTALARRISPLPGIETTHLTGALVGVLGLWGAQCLARRLGGPVAGLCAVLLLATTPVYYGHLFNNPKDLPFAVGYIWALDALCAVVLRMPRVPRRAWVRFAVLAGLAMGVRIAGILLLAYLGAVVVAMGWRRARATGSLDAGLASVRRLGRPALAAMVGAWVVMLAPWPWALLDPLRRPWMALGRMSRFTIHRRTMPFAGEEMLTTEPRADYLLHYFGLKLPVLVLALVLVAGALVVIAVLRRRHQSRGIRDVTGVLAMALLAPPAYAVVMRSVLYDGLRHFLFLVPVLAVVAALAAVSLPRRWPRAGPWVALGLVVGGGWLMTRQVLAMRRLHPHQYIYFNELAGGLPGASGNYDTDYYGNSYREGFATLAEHLWTQDRAAFLDSRYLVTGCIPEFIARRYLEGNFTWADKISDGAQFYLGYTRSKCHERYRTSPELLRIEREGVMLLMIRDLRHATDERRDRGELDQGPGMERRGSNRAKARDRSRSAPAAQPRPDAAFRRKRGADDRPGEPPQPAPTDTEAEAP